MLNSKRLAFNILRRRLLLRIAYLVALTSTLFLGVIYTSFSLNERIDSFSVHLVNASELDNKIGLSLNKDFTKASSFIEASRLNRMDNISESWLPEDINEIDGNHNGDNYIALTFYLKNLGIGEIEYEREIIISEVLRGADEAIRIKVYLNDEAKLYAKKNPFSAAPEANTIPFLDEKWVLKEARPGFKPSEVDKYTVVIFLEGNDPECIDAIRNGKIKMTMNFTIINGGENEKKRIS